MIEVLPGSEGNLLAVKASGTVTDEDYKTVFIPKLEGVMKEHGKARLLFVFADDFRKYELAAAWDDATFGVKHRSDFEKAAIVGGPGWIEWATKLVARMMPGEVKFFETEAEAWAWIKA